MERQQFETANLTDALANTSETVQELKNENSQLQSSLSQHKTIPFPVSRLLSFIHVHVPRGGSDSLAGPVGPAMARPLFVLRHF